MGRISRFIERIITRNLELLSAPIEEHGTGPYVNISLIVRRNFFPEIDHPVLKVHKLPE
jgi:hypothetical protein